MGGKTIWTEPVLGRNRERLIERCQEAIARGRSDSFIYLVATRPLLDHITARLLDGRRVSGCRELRVFLFDGLIARILRHAGVERRLIEEGMKYFLLERIISRLGEAGVLQHIAAIAHLPGTIESVGQLIGELKRAGMPPSEFRQFISATSRPRPRDLDIAAIYEAYQRELDDRALMDADEATYRALEVLRSRPDLPPWLETTEVLFIDGFFDFTPIQKHLLRYLIERIPEAIINLTYDPRHPSVFQEPLGDTLRYLQSFSEPMEMEHFEATLPHRSELEPLRFGLFRAGPPAEAQSPPITIVAAASASHEIEEVAREVKRLIGEEGYRPHEIAIIAREPSGYLEAMHEQLRRLNIPSTLDVTQPLVSIPSVKAAVRVLDARVGKESTEPYVALLKSDYLHHFSALERDAIENAVLVVGLELPMRQWRQRVREIRRIKEHEVDTVSARVVDLEEVELELARLRRGIAQLDGALEAIDGMRRALDEIPERGTLAEMIAGFFSALRAFRLEERLHQRLNRAGDDDGALRLLARDLRGWEMLRRTLSDIRRWAEAIPHAGSTAPADFAEERHPPASEVITVEQFRDLVTHMLERTPFRIERGDPGGVRLLEVTQSRGLPFRAVFIVGLVEGLFPQSPVRDWIYPYQERQRLAEAGLYLEDLSPKLFQAKEEHFFYHAACQATERLILTYPRADAAGEQNVVSSFIEEVRRLYRHGEESTVPVQWRQPNPYEVRTVASWPELGRAILASLYQTTPDDALVLHLYNRALDAGVLTDSAFARLRMEAERRGSAFGPFDGVLLDPVIRQQLRARFGPTRVYSASQLNTYGQCPFRFFCQRILRLEEREEASLDLVALDRGWLLHTILYRFLERHTDANLVRPRQREYEEELNRIADEVFGEYEGRALPIQRSLWELEKEEIRDTLMRFLEAELTYQERVLSHSVQPHWLELGFGMTDMENSHPDSRREYYVLRRDGDVIQLRGRIDRVDRSADGKYIVYDYKSGSGASTRQMREGLDLQIPLYMKALEGLFLGPDEEVIGGGYYSLKAFHRRNGLYREEFQSHTGIGRTASNLSTEEWEEIIAGAEQYAWQYVQGMRRGDFRVQPKEDACCPRCLYKTVCRYERHRIRGKSSPD
ncbi:MAG: hypothetical protein D6723_06215 [Acidobacteria bacterium]|nr:MAG: hypothetical protein D6723_06215 [Acidobacteriota bacterium]